MADRRYDIVLFGATGFAGELTAEYLARHAPDGCRWALAGRNRGQARDRARASSPPSIRRCPHSTCSSPTRPTPRRSPTSRGSTKVVATTVGPYVLHGEALVAACAAAGTDYVDLTGEPEFVDTMYVRLPRAGGRDRRPPGPRLRIRLDPARPRRVLHRAAVARGRPADGARLRPGVGDVLRRDVRAPRSPASRGRGRTSRRPASASGSRTAARARRAAPAGARTARARSAAGRCRSRPSTRR